MVKNQCRFLRPSSLELEKLVAWSEMFGSKNIRDTQWQQNPPGGHSIVQVGE